MILKEKIALFKEEQHSKVPHVILEKLDGMRAEIVSTGFLGRALNIGDNVPDFSLFNQYGEAVRLGGLLGGGQVILNFFRGSWCKVDMLELEALKTQHEAIIDKGCKLISISPERPSNSLSLYHEHQLPFDILYDERSRIADLFGISYTMPEMMRDIYDAYGIDISEYNGDQSFKLPVPATYILGEDKKIQFAFADMDHWERVEPKELLYLLGT